MTSKQRVSLRRRQKVKKDENQISEHDDDFELKSPNRAVPDDPGHSKVLSPRFRSPIVTPASKCKPPPRIGEASLDDSLERLSSQEPTPSKWNYLLPDFNSQPDGVVADVLWDCSSPDAVKHLRRVQKDNSNIKELIKYFKEPAADGRSRSPPLQLQLLRASLQRQVQKQKKKHDNNKRKQKRLAQKRKQKQKDKEREQELFDQILSAVAKREELEAKGNEEKQSGCPVCEVAREAAGIEEDEDEDEDSWEDDDLFENNSFIIDATQNPYQFFKGCSSESKTSTPILAEKIPGQCIEAYDYKNPEGDHVTSSNSSVMDSQNSEVIPPTCVMGKLKVSADPKPRNLLDSFALAGNDENKCDKKSDKAKNDTVVGLEKRKQGHGQLIPLEEVYDEELKPSTFSASSSKYLPLHKSASSAGRSKTNLTSENKIPAHLSRGEIQQKTEITFKNANRTGQLRGAHQSQEKNKSSSVRSKQGHTLASCDNFNDDMSDDGLSDELFLRVPEQCDMFESQLIQEFPTQATTKLSACASLLSAKHVNSHVDDFADDLDSDLLASACAFDSSFAESPISKERPNEYPVKSVPQDRRNKDMKPGHSDNKLLKLQGGPKTACSAASEVVNNSKTSGQRNCSTDSAKPKGNQSNKNWSSSSSMAYGLISKHQNAIPARNGGLVFPPFAENQQDKKPLSSLAMGSTVPKKPLQAGRKFVFKPVVSASSLPGRAAQTSKSDPELGLTSPSSKPSSNAAGNSKQTSSLDISCSQLKLDSADDLDDDPLYESQIMAILDQVENQATQQMAAQASCSQESASIHPKCSQEEIEKKRQAAMERRLRSATSKRQ